MGGGGDLISRDFSGDTGAISDRVFLCVVETNLPQLNLSSTIQLLKKEESKT